MGSGDDPVFLSPYGRRLPGVRRAVNIAAPAAGADISLKVPGGVMWRVVSLHATLTTSAVAGSRFPGWVVKVDGVTVVNYSAGISNTANGGPNDFTFAPGAGAAVQAAFFSGWIPIPDFIMPSNAVFGPITNGLLAGDQWSAGGLLIEELYVTDQELSERREHDLDDMRAAYAAAEQKAS